MRVDEVHRCLDLLVGDVDIQRIVVRDRQASHLVRVGGRVRVRARARVRVRARVGVTARVRVRVMVSVGLGRGASHLLELCPWQHRRHDQGQGEESWRGLEDLPG